MTQNTIEFDQLSEKDLILTPNRRLCAWLVRDYDQWMMAQGNQAWRSPRTLPLDAWLQEMYHLHSINPRTDGAPTLLSPQQCRVIWKNIVQEEEEFGVDIEGLVQLCIQARQLIKRWLLSDENWQQSDTTEHEFFYHCYRKFEAQLQRKNWIDQPAIAEYLTGRNAFGDDQIENVYLHGFNDLSEPGLLNIRNWLEQSKLNVRFSNQERFESTLNAIACSKYVDQFRQALFWAIEQWLKNPSARIGIVVPNLQSQKLTIQQFCEDISTSNSDLLGMEWQNVINITAGEPLSQYPVVSHLLLLLNGFKGSLKLAEWDVLLKSPYFTLGFAGLEKLDSQSRFELFDQFIEWLKQHNRNHYNFSQLQLSWQAFYRRWAQLDAEEALSLFTRAEGDSDMLPSWKQSGFSNWLRWLEKTLDAIGWGQQRTLNSVEFQVLHRFKEMQRSIIELDPLLPSLTYSSFVKELAQQTKSIVFQPQTETAPVQIMGVLEAAGLNFDALWVCECESDNWPQVTNPNPLIPRKTLIRFSMPGSGPEREMAYARTLLSGFRTAARDTVFSWSRFEGEVEHRLSPLLEDLNSSAYQASKLVTATRIEQQRRLLEYIVKTPVNEQGSAVSDGKVKGGSALIKAQSLCPFKAFAEYRLGIKASDEIDEGIKASDRGNLVHKVLEEFWLSINGYAELSALLADESLLDKHLLQLIEREMVSFKKNIFLHPEALYELEQERTFNTVKNWLLTAEQFRAPFKIDRVEKKQTIKLAGLELNLTVDRIDLLEDGSKIIIDYKTGLVTTGSWFGERPEEPQLPLYTLLQSNASKGIYFAIVRPEKSEWQGLGEEGIQFSQVHSRSLKTPESGWDQQVENWKKVLEALAKEFLQGIATVTPSKESTCQFCHLSPVCRIKELNSADN